MVLTLHDFAPARIAVPGPAGGMVAPESAMKEPQHRRLAPPPGPRGRLLAGSLSELRRDPLGTLEAGHRGYGDLLRLRLGPPRPLGPGAVYGVGSPELAEEVLVTRPGAFPKLSTGARKPVGLQVVLGNGLLTNRDPDSWLTQRRLMQPVFHRQSLVAMGDRMQAAGARLLRRWGERYAPGDTVDVGQEMREVTLDVFSRTMFGADVLEHTRTFGAAATFGAAFVARRSENPLSLPLWAPLPGHLAFRRHLRALDRVLYGVLDARLAARADGARGASGPGDLLDLLLDARDAETGAGMSREQLRDELATLFMAGHETTAHALTWAWALLAHHPEVAGKLRAELDAVLGGRPPSLDDLPILPYTRAVFEETLRLYPTAPILARRVAADTTLGGYRVAAGRLVFVSVYSIHRRPDLWDEPERFRPERFVAPPTAPAPPASGRPRLAYMPFGAGQRRCIGVHFAQLEAQLLLAQIAQRYELRLAPPAGTEAGADPEAMPEYELAITLRPRHPVRMTLLPRTPGAA
jgi:cytochrome P450